MNVNKKAILSISILIIFVSLFALYIIKNKKVRLISNSSGYQNELISQQNQKNEFPIKEQPDLQIDDNKEKMFKEAYEGIEIINKTDFKGQNSMYCVIELKNPQFKNFNSSEPYLTKLYSTYELYCYKTGIRENLYIYAKVLSFNIINENKLSFICKGDPIRNTFDSFPYVLELNRIKEEKLEREYHFSKKIIDHYIGINESSTFGSGNRNVLDIKINNNGMQVIFNDALYSGAAYVPYTNISYDKNKQQMIINIPKSKLSKDFDKESIVTDENSAYIKSLSISEATEGINIYVSLLNDNLTYNVKCLTISDNTKKIAYPYFDISYK